MTVEPFCTSLKVVVLLRLVLLRVSSSSSSSVLVGLWLVGVGDSSVSDSSDVVDGELDVVGDDRLEVSSFCSLVLEGNVDEVCCHHGRVCWG